MLRRLVSSACVFALVFAFSACSDDTSNPKPDTVVVKDGSVDTTKPDGPAVDGPKADLGPTPDLMQADLPAGPSGRIGVARQLPDGSTNIPIEGAYVTYIKSAVGNDIGGFFIQAEKTGPALFIGVDPQTLTPVPKVGDQIDITITEMATDSTDIRYAKAVSGVATTTPATDPLPALIQDVSSAADLVTNIVDYETELVTGTFTITKPFAAAGTGFVAAEADTAGVTANVDLKFRVPETLRNTLGLVPGCVIKLAATPMWHYKTTAQPSAFVEADIATLTCPLPSVVRAAAKSSTSMRVTFDRPVTAVNANGSEFTFDNGLTASAATLDASKLSADVTTSAQTSATSYTVTVNASVGVDGTKNTATFLGYTQPATVVFNELNANITGGCDLIEFRVTAAGSLANFTVYERDSLLYTFPVSFPVASGDIIVLHLDSGDSNCNPAGATDELTGIAQFPVATHTRNYDTAWDLWSSRTGLIATTNVFQLFDDNGQMVDALLAHDGTTGTVTSATLVAANLAATANQWTPVPTGGFDATNFRTDTVGGLKGTGTTAAGDSLQRGAADTNAKADWASAASTFGVKNAGQ